MPGQSRPKSPVAANDTILQLKVRLLGISPMIWRRLLVEDSSTLDELHGVIQIAMGWEAVHLFRFELRAVAFGSIELGLRSPNVPLSHFELRKGSKLAYVYDMGDNWRHEIRVERRLHREPGRRYPHCISGARSGPPEDCGGAEGYRRRCAETTRIDAFDDLGTLSATFRELLDTGATPSLDDEQTRWRFEQALERTEARASLMDDKFSSREVNERLGRGDHELLIDRQL